MKNLFLWMAGYRKYRFTLFTGRKVVFLTRTKGQAIQKALNLERKIRANQVRTMKILTADMDIGRRDVPSELVRNVLSA